MPRGARLAPLSCLVVLAAVGAGCATGSVELTRAGEPARLEVRPAGERGVRVTLKPLSFGDSLPFTPALDERRPVEEPVLSLTQVGRRVRAQVGELQVEVRGSPLTVALRRASGEAVQTLVFEDDGRVSFPVGTQPVLGLGEGGPQPGDDWRTAHRIEFDRRGRLHELRPRWQSNAYGSRNPVPLLAGTEGWGLFVATPWVQVDLSGETGAFIPWQRPEPPHPDSQQARSYTAQVQGRPPASQPVEVFDAFVFDARDPAAFMRDVAAISGPAVLPPRWALGYMQSHRELRDSRLQPEELLLDVVDTFREKRIPLDAVIYLGTGFTPTGWNTPQPSFDFNPEVFRRDPAQVIADLHERNAKVILHIVPWRRDRLPTLQGTIPPGPGETVDASHILDYWQQHTGLVAAGVDAWWPDEGDWFDLFERMKRHQLYYQGPLSTTPNVRPWSLHRNGHLGVARWGGWVWSGDTQATWKTLEGQIAVGINHSLSLGPYWGSDTGGFYTTDELTGELYARWFQFSAFTPSFRSHGRIWRLRLPWGWGLGDMGFLEGQREPPDSAELGNPAIEPITRAYAELRYQLIPYTYTLAREAYDTGLPLMRALWLHYPADERARGIGDQYLWGRDVLVAPVYERGAVAREVYLPPGAWYDWWSGARHEGGRTVTRAVDLATMPLFVRAGAIIPLDPVRQYMDQVVEGPTTLRVYRGADGEFALYDDDGISLDYLEGGGTFTRLTWDDAARRLVIHEAAGVGAGPTRRAFLVELFPGGETRRVRYDGSRVEVQF